MKSIKKIMTATLALILVMNLAACENKQKHKESTKETSTEISTQEKEVTRRLHSKQKSNPLTLKPLHLLS